MKDGYKIYYHKFRSEMIKRLCVQVYKLEEGAIPEDIEKTLGIMTYQDLIKPLIYIEYKNGKPYKKIAFEFGITERMVKTAIYSYHNNI